MPSFGKDLNVDKLGEAQPIAPLCGATWYVAMLHVSKPGRTSELSNQFQVLENRTWYIVMSGIHPCLQGIVWSPHISHTYMKKPLNQVSTFHTCTHNHTL